MGDFLGRRHTVVFALSKRPPLHQRYLNVAETEQDHVVDITFSPPPSGFLARM